MILMKLLNEIINLIKVIKEWWLFAVILLKNWKNIGVPAIFFLMFIR